MLLIDTFIIVKFADLAKIKPKFSSAFRPVLTLAFIYASSATLRAQLAGGTFRDCLDRSTLNKKRGENYAQLNWQCLFAKMSLCQQHI